METEGVRASADVDDGEGGRRRGREETSAEGIAGAGRVQVPSSKKKRYKNTGAYAIANCLLVI